MRRWWATRCTSSVRRGRWRLAGCACVCALVTGWLAVCLSVWCAIGGYFCNVDNLNTVGSRKCFSSNVYVLDVSGSGNTIPVAAIPFTCVLVATAAPQQLLHVAVRLAGRPNSAPGVPSLLFYHSATVVRAAAAAKHVGLAWLAVGIGWLLAWLAVGLAGC